MCICLRLLLVSILNIWMLEKLDFIEICCCCRPRRCEDGTSTLRWCLRDEAGAFGVKSAPLHAWPLCARSRHHLIRADRTRSPFALASRGSRHQHPDWARGHQHHGHRRRAGAGAWHSSWRSPISLLVFFAERPTPTTRQVTSGGPPPQVLRDPGQPRDTANSDFGAVSRLF